MKKIHPKTLPDAARILSKILIKLKVVINTYKTISNIKNKIGTYIFIL